MHFKDIPQFPQSHYCVDVPWSQIRHVVDDYAKEYRLDLSPKFQRAHVWTPVQKTAFVEYILRGGESSRHIYFNHPSWTRGFKESDRMVIVDGKQRLDAVLGFMEDRVKAFGHFRSQIEDAPRSFSVTLKFHVAGLKTEREVLEWYLALNAGGTPHTKEEIEKVRLMLKETTCLR